METQKSLAMRGVLTPLVKQVAINEGVEQKHLMSYIANGSVVITANTLSPNKKKIAIGKGLTTKINANIGTSIDNQDIGQELEKLKIAIEFGADTVMDLSTGGDIDKIRREILDISTIPVGTVPIYHTICKKLVKGRSISDVTADDMFESIEIHGEEGVDFITVHCGVTKESIKRMSSEGRILNIVSRGGALLYKWIQATDKENPLFEQFDRLLEIAKKYDMILSLGDGMRPGCLADSLDRAQIQETIILGELTKKAHTAGVQVIIEGPGHVPINQIEANVVLEKRLCHGAPYYVLGPIVTDIAPGYDHITAAIGGAIAAYAGADFLCYVTPSEHLRLPSIEDVKQGVIASKIAAHAADIAKDNPLAIKKDKDMAVLRQALEWDEQMKLVVDPTMFKKMRGENPPKDHEACSMCSDLCPIKLSDSLD